MKDEDFYMNNKIKLKTLSVGYADGETESESSDYDFTDLFYTKNLKVEEIMKPTSYIISGRKGTGKTILAKYVKVKQEEEYKILSSQYINLPDDIKQEEFIERNYNAIKEDEYNLFPKFYILRTIAKLILSKKISLIEHLKYSQENRFFSNIYSYFKYKKAYKYLKHFQNERYPEGNLVLQELKQEASNNIKLSAGTQIGENPLILNSSHENSHSESVSKNFSINTFVTHIEKIEKNILECLKVKPIMLIFDDIDDIKKYIDNDTQVEKFLIGMIKCVKNINSKIYKQNKLNKCIIIIRDDILQTLNASDSNLNKTIIVSEVNLDWIGNKQEDMLINMILHKISQGNSSLKNKKPNEVIRMFFTGKKYSESLSIMKKIIDYCFGRPRDIITYLSIIIRNNKNRYKISHTMIKNAYNEYSNAFWNELQNELSFYYSKEFINSIKNILSSLGKINFSYQEIKTIFENNSAEYRHIDDFDNFMNAMYKFGIIGTYRREEGKKPKASFSYRKDGNAKLNTNDSITVHYGLTPVFNL